MSPRRSPLAAAAIAVGLLSGCDDVAQPFELAHPRVIAVRSEPPALRADDRARIDVLVTGAAHPRR